MNIVALNPSGNNNNEISSCRALVSYTAVVAESYAYMSQALAAVGDGKTRFRFKTEVKRVGNVEMAAVLNGI